MGCPCTKPENGVIKIKKEVDLSLIIKENKPPITSKMDIQQQNNQCLNPEIQNSPKINEKTIKQSSKFKNIKENEIISKDKTSEQEIENNLLSKKKKFISAESLIQINSNHKEKELKISTISKFNLVNKMDEFSKKVYEEINMSRTNCLEYSKKIDNFSKQILFDKIKNQKYFSIPSSHKKIYLPKNDDGFNECSKFFKDIYIKYKKDKKFPRKLRFVEELKFPLNQDDIENSINKEYISKTYQKLKKILDGIYDIYNMIYFKSFDNPEISTMLEIIDQENNYRVRYCLLNDSLKYIGISHGKLKNGSIIVFIILAN